MVSTQHTKGRTAASTLRTDQLWQIRLRASLGGLGGRFGVQFSIHKEARLHRVVTLKSRFSELRKAPKEPHLKRMGECGGTVVEEEGDVASYSVALIDTGDERKSMASRLQHHLWKDVDPDQSNIPLAAYCFMTGFMDAITFTAVSVWCGFQTGNTIELALASARFFSPSEPTTPGTSLLNHHSLTSITCFLLGAFLGRIGDRMGARTRGWLFFGTMLQAMFTMLAAILLWKSAQEDGGFPAHPIWSGPEGYGAMGFASASMGLQGIMGKRVNTQFATTVVLTTVWCELMADPCLFRTGFVRMRELKIIAVCVLFLGGFLGRLLLDRIGFAAACIVGSALRVLIALLWLGIPCEGGIELL